MRTGLFVCAVAMCLTACGPTWGGEEDESVFADDARPAVEIAEDIFAIEHGELRERCKADARKGEFEEMDASALGVMCGTKYQAAAACFLGYDGKPPRFAIDTDSVSKKEVWVHEYLHFMLVCQAWDAKAADPDHLDPVWEHLGNPYQIGRHAAGREHNHAE